jgi:hypothetical protein
MKSLVAIAVVLTIGMMGCSPRTVKERADADPTHVYLVGLENDQYVFRFDQHTYRAHCQSSRKLASAEVDDPPNCESILSFIGQRLPAAGSGYMGSRNVYGCVT